MITSGMHVQPVAVGDERISRVRIEGVGEPVELSVTSTHPLVDDLTPWVSLLVPAAMGAGVPLHLHGRVDATALRGMERAQTILADWFPTMVRRIAVTTDEIVPANAPSSGVGLLFSGGVDAFHSALLHRERITHLLFVHGFDIPLWRTELRASVSRRLTDVARELGVELVEATTDVKPWADQFVRWGEIYHGAATAGVALAHACEFGEALIASSDATEDLVPWASHPDLDPQWSSTGMQVIHDAIEFTRMDKVREIASWDLAMKHLRVCWENPDQAYNCGVCEKCVRTQVNLHLVGALERCETLPHTIDLARVRQPAVEGEARLQIAANLRWLRAASTPDRELERALATSLRRGGVLAPLDRHLVRPAREHAPVSVRRVVAAIRRRVARSG